MPKRTVIAFAAASGLIAGVASTATLTDDNRPRNAVTDLLLPLLAEVIPVACLTVISMRIIRRWLDSYTASTRKELQAADQQRQEISRSIDRRLTELARRESALKRHEAATTRLRQALDEQRQIITELTAERDDLAEDYNVIVCQTLQQAADKFRLRPPAASDGNPAPCVPLSARPPNRRATITRFERGHSDSVLP